jgi:nucleoside-diphosphate-sugar epimerase
MRVLLIGSEGYIGSSLAFELRDYDLDCCDIGWFGANASVLYKKDYRDIKGLTIEKYDAVILLAGHNSVKMCRDMKSAYLNNVVNFMSLIDRLGDVPLIYASSGSVYGNGEQFKQFFEHDPLPAPMNWYDHTKQEIDRIARLSGKNTYGLRFGTVNGASPNMRTELMLNSMVLSAQNTNLIKASNYKVNRAILALPDLNRAIKAILKHIEKKGAKNTGVYNLCSFNANIEYLVERTAHLTKSYIEKQEDSPTYSFMLNCQKFQETFDWAPKETVESIILDLQKNCGKINEAERKRLTRDRVIEYA